jgi:hypothetical protein
MARTTRSSEPSRASASKARPPSKRSALRQARIEIRQLAEGAVNLARTEPPTSRYALAFLGSLSPRHLMYPPLTSAELSKIADAQADILEGVVQATFDGIGLTSEQYDRGNQLLVDGLRAATVPGWEPA